MLVDMRPIAIVAAVFLVVACRGEAVAAAQGENSQPDPKTATQERTGVIGRKGKGQTLRGPNVDVGAPAPPFRLVDSKGKPVDSADLRGKLVVLSVVPSIETPVCEAQTARMAQAEAGLPPATVLLTVSRDKPEVQEKFLTDANLHTRMASDTTGKFGEAFGLHVMETGRLARSVWVINGAGTITYRELVADQSTEPNYDALLAAVARVGSAPK
jgi:thiol peroxidase